MRLRTLLAALVLVACRDGDAQADPPAADAAPLAGENAPTVTPVTMSTAAPAPPSGNYLCYYYGMSFALTSSSLTQVRVLDGARLVIAGDTVSFHPTEGDAFALDGGSFPGLVFHSRTDDDGKAQLVLVRKENEAKGHEIDISDTYCYLE
jgi:hypothetical protein